MNSFAFERFEITETGLIHSFTNRYKRNAMVKRMINRCIQRYIQMHLLLQIKEAPKLQNYFANGLTYIKKFVSKETARRQKWITP